MNASNAREIEFVYDFGSPNAYLAWKVLPDIADRRGAGLISTPILLGGLFRLTGNRSPNETFAGVKNKLEYEQLDIDRFVAKHHLDAFRHNPHFPVNTLVLMRGAVAAAALGIADAYQAAIFAGMWENGQKLDDERVFDSVLDAAGLPVAELSQLCRSPEIKQQLIDNTQKAFDRGAFGAPSFFIGNDLYFGKDRLREIEEALQGDQRIAPEI